MGIDTYFCGLASRSRAIEYCARGTGVWEDVASGYWTPSLKWSSGLVSHYGSTPSSSARVLGQLYLTAIIKVFEGWRTYWLAAPDDYRGF